MPDILRDILESLLESLRFILLLDTEGCDVRYLTDEDQFHPAFVLSVARLFVSNLLKRRRKGGVGISAYISP